MAYTHTIASRTWHFADLKTLLAKASPARSGDELAGIAARMALAEVPLKRLLEEALIPYETDEVTRLIIDTHDASAFAEISHLTAGDFRNWLLSTGTDTATLTRIAPGITPEMAAAVSKLMRNQDLILAAQKCRVENQVLVAHQLRDGGCHLGRD